MVGKQQPSEFADQFEQRNDVLTSKLASSPPVFCKSPPPKP